MRIKTFFFKMATKEMDVNTENEVKISGETESPSKEVSRKRKTKVEIMETDTAAKKPNFPPVAIEEGVKNIFHKINLKNCFGWVSFFFFFFFTTPSRSFSSFGGSKSLLVSLFYSCSRNKF